MINWAYSLAGYYIGLVAGILVMTGCTTASSVRTQVSKDLQEIAGYQDCESICYSLKLYLKNKYGIEIPEPKESGVAAK